MAGVYRPINMNCYYSEKSYYNIDLVCLNMGMIIKQAILEIHNSYFHILFSFAPCADDIINIISLAMYVLRIKPRSSGRPVSAPNQ